MKTSSCIQTQFSISIAFFPPVNLNISCFLFGLIENAPVNIFFLQVWKDHQQRYLINQLNEAIVVIYSKRHCNVKLRSSNESENEMVASA